jgi:hypothetical protein
VELSLFVGEPLCAAKPLTKSGMNIASIKTLGSMEECYPQSYGIEQEILAGQDITVEKLVGCITFNFGCPIH